MRARPVRKSDSLNRLRVAVASSSAARRASVKPWKAIKMTNARITANGPRDAPSTPAARPGFAHQPPSARRARNRAPRVNATAIATIPITRAGLTPANYLAARPYLECSRVSLAQPPCDLDVLLCHRLLRQPGGFEGFGVIQVELSPQELSIAKLPDRPNLLIYRDAASRSLSHHSVEDNDAIVTCVEEPLKFHVELLHHGGEVIHVSRHTVKSPVSPLLGGREELN